MVKNGCLLHCLESVWLHTESAHRKWRRIQYIIFIIIFSLKLKCLYYSGCLISNTLSSKGVTPFEITYRLNFIYEKYAWLNNLKNLFWLTRNVFLFSSFPWRIRSIVIGITGGYNISSLSLSEKKKHEWFCCSLWCNGRIFKSIMLIRNCCLKYFNYIRIILIWLLFILQQFAKDSWPLLPPLISRTFHHFLCFCPL